MDELEFAQRLKRYRRERGLTQQELADRIGVSNKSVSRWESGSYPDVPTLLSLARALDVTVDALLDPGAPVPTLQKSDWQNLLSFAFAIGGGLAFLFTAEVRPRAGVLGPLSGLSGLRHLSPDSLHLSRPLVPPGQLGHVLFASVGPWRKNWGAWCFRCFFPQF